MLYGCIGAAVASAVAAHGPPGAFAFSLPGASLNEVVEIAAVALAPMRFYLVERRRPDPDSSLPAEFRSAASQIVLDGTPACIMVTIEVELASSPTNAEQVRRATAQHFATNLREAARTRVQPGAEAVHFGCEAELGQRRRTP